MAIMGIVQLLMHRWQAAKPDAIAKLSALPGVVVIPVTPELRARQEHSRIWNETWLAAFFHKPCNHELFVHQSLNMEGAPTSWSIANESQLEPEPCLQVV